MEDVEDKHGSNGSISGSTGGIWYLALSLSLLSQRARRDSRGKGWEQSEGREPHLNTLACTFARAFSSSTEGTRMRFTSSLLPRETLSPSLVSLPLPPCASVIMCSHIGVPVEHRGRQCGGGEKHRERRWVEKKLGEGRKSGRPRGGPYPVYVQAAPAAV